MAKKDSCRYFLSKNSPHHVDMLPLLNFELRLAEECLQEFDNYFHSNIVPKDMSHSPLGDYSRHLVIVHTHKLHSSNSHKLLHPIDTLLLGTLYLEIRIEELCL